MLSGDGSQVQLPRWSNRVALAAFAAVFVLGTLGAAAFAYAANGDRLAVGYSPMQPVDFRHKLHAGELAMDCRYCHWAAEESSFAAVPTTESCLNCHSKVRSDSPQLVLVRERFEHDTPIPWIRVHNLPDFVYFDHRVHLAAGVGCSTCHGRVDQMERIEQTMSLTMGWCLECHRAPGPSLRSPADVTKMDWPSVGPAGAPGQPPSIPRVAGSVSPPTHCSGCHR